MYYQYYSIAEIQLLTCASNRSQWPLVDYTWNPSRLILLMIIVINPFSPDSDTL